MYKSSKPPFFYLFINYHAFRGNALKKQTWPIVIYIKNDSLKLDIDFKTYVITV